ncbi:sigma factor-like helix-turn-helix DNA-binding protein [Methylophaga sp. OBS4]|uniref:sigma factor-like helix-turn-helix DNA-binding protein n=1 Tax=Methylophaga sp. OBS4 TaxID=2991935 RepID=UPI00225184A8|nr:sigma factor-like helix-turn-helix DNA-binding protein [Methylophaga sp. OBS4]MCX4186742.1 hypothetical protein [Methylophaga sp. OBS4]
MKAHIRPTSQSKDIDLGLAVLDIVRPIGRALTHAEIGDICGCSGAYIHQVEQRAIKKIKRRLGNLSDFLAEDVIERHAQTISYQLEGVIS